MTTDTLTVEIDTALLDRVRAGGEDSKAPVGRLLRRAALAKKRRKTSTPLMKDAIDANNLEIEARGALSERLAGWR